MDIAPEYSGTASGFMNFGFGMAGIVSPVVFGAIIDATGRWDLPFAGSLGLLLIGAGLAFTMRPGQRFIAEPEIRAGLSLIRRCEHAGKVKSPLKRGSVKRGIHERRH